MIDDAPRSASVIALRETKLSFVSSAAFNAFGAKRPELYRYLTTLLAQRLRDTNDIVAASFLSLKGSRRTRAVEPCRSVWTRCWQRPHCPSAKDFSKRNRRDGRRGTGEC
jgi:CRP-like cAMP-binding protein